MLAAAVFEFFYPLVSSRGYSGWRVLFGVAATPVLVVVWIKFKVRESPVWLRHREEMQETQTKAPLSVGQDIQARSDRCDAANLNHHERIYVLLLFDLILVSNTASPSQAVLHFSF